MAISIGEIKGSVVLEDRFSAVTGKLSGDIGKIVSRIDELEKKFEQSTKKQKRDTDTLSKQYSRLSADLDPVVKRTQRYDSAVDILTKSLKEGRITQEKFNTQVELAKSKYLSSSSATAKLEKESAQLSKQYSKLIADLSPLAKRTQQYDAVVAILRKTLAQGAISQAEFNKQLDLAKRKYLEIDSTLDKLSTRGSQLSNLGQTLTIGVTAPIAGIGALSTRAATQFESSFAGVNKTVDGITDSFGKLTLEGLKLQRGLRDLAAGKNPIPIDINELNAIAESAGQLGIARENILSFTRTMADLGVTTNLSSLEAADSIARLQNIFNAAGKDTDRFGSTLVALGNASASTERDILSMGVRIASAGNQIGLTQGQVLAIASTLSSVGIEAEAGGSAISKVMIDMAVAVANGGRELENFASVSNMTAENFQRAFRDDAAGALQAFIKGLQGVNGEQVLRVLDEMGIAEVRMRNAILATVGAGDLLADNLELQARAWEENTALTQEAEKRYQTFESQMRIVRQQLADVGITLGSALIPLLKDTIASGQPLIQTAKDLAEWFSRLDSTSKTIIVSFGGVAVSIGPILFVSGQLVQSWTTLVAFSPRIAALAGPWAGVAAVIGTVSLASITLIDRWEEASKQATALNIKLGNLYGSALAFQQQMAKAGNAISRSAALKAREDARQLAIELNAAKERLDAVAKERERWGRFHKRTEFAELTAEVQRLNTIYERQKKAVSSINAIYDDSAKETKSLAVDTANLGKQIDIVTKQEEKLQKRLKDTQAISKNRIDNASVKAVTEHYKHLAEITDAAFKANREELKKNVELLEDFLKIIKEIDQEFIKSARERVRDQIQSGGNLATSTTRERVDFANEWRASWRSISENAQIEIEKVNRSILTIPEKERAIADIREQMVLDTIASWQTGLDFLANMFDGFFADLARGVQQLTSAYQTFSGIGKSMNLGGSAASSLGWFGVFVAVVDIASGLVKAHRQNQRNREFQLGASALGQRDAFGEWQISAAQDTRLNIIKQSRDASNSINEAMEEMARAFGGVVKTFESIQINIRRDGKYFEALVGNELLGIYGSFEEAMEAALQASLLAAETIITGLSDLVQEGLAGLRSGEIGRTSSLDQVVDFLSALKEISELGMPQGAIQIQELTRRFDVLWQQLARVGRATDATAQGFTNLIGAEGEGWESWSRSIRGVQQTREEELAARRREGEMFNKMRPLRVAELNLQILEWKAKAESVRARGQIVRSGALIDQTEIEAGIAYVQAKGTLVKAEVEITNQYLEFINQIIKAIEDLIATLEAIPDIDIGDIKLPRTGGAGSGRDAARDFIADRRFEISTRGMTDYQRAVAELNRTYEEQFENAGKDLKLRAQLNELKKEELALLAQEAARNTVASFRQFLGLVSPFDQVRETAAGLIKEIEGSPFGDARKAAMIGRVMEDLDRQIEEMSKQEAVSLFGDMIGRMEQLGASSIETADARRHLAILEHTLAIDNYKKRIAVLRAEGNIAPAILDALENSVNWLEAQTDKIINGLTDDGRRFRGYDDAPLSNVINAAERFGDALEKATDLLNKYKDQGLDPLRRDLVQIVGDFRTIRKTLGDTPDVIQTYTRSIQRALDNFLEPTRQTRRDLFFGDASPFDTMQQWVRIQSDLETARARYNAGDLNAVADLNELVPEYVRIARLVTPIGSQRYLDLTNMADQLLAEVESLTIDELGTFNNPMNVDGIDELTALNEAQLDTLDRIYDSNVAVVDAVQALNTANGPIMLGPSANF